MESSALLAPVAMGEFGLNLCGGVGWRDGFRPIAAVQKRHPEAAFDLLHAAVGTRVVCLRKL